MEFASIEQFLKLERRNHGGQDQKNIGDSKDSKMQEIREDLEQNLEDQARLAVIQECLWSPFWKSLQLSVKLKATAKRLQARAEAMEIDQNLPEPELDPELTEPEEDEDLPEPEPDTQVQAEDEDEDDDVQILRRNPRRGGGQRVDYTRFYV